MARRSGLNMYQLMKSVCVVYYYVLLNENESRQKQGKSVVLYFIAYSTDQLFCFWIVASSELAQGGGFYTFSTYLHYENALHFSVDIANCYEDN